MRGSSFPFLDAVCLDKLGNRSNRGRPEGLYLAVFELSYNGDGGVKLLNALVGECYNQVETLFEVWFCFDQLN